MEAEFFHEVGLRDRRKYRQTQRTYNRICKFSNAPKETREFDAFNSYVKTHNKLGCWVFEKPVWFGAPNSNVTNLQYLDVFCGVMWTCFIKDILSPMSLRPWFEARFRWLATSRNQSLLLASFPLHTREFSNPVFSTHLSYVDWKTWQAVHFGNA